jgi:hypothetical protein
MNSYVVSGLTGEAEDRQIWGYTHGPNGEKGRVVPADSNGRVTELIESTIRALHTAMWVGSCVGPCVATVTAPLKFIKYCH